MKFKYFMWAECPHCRVPEGGPLPEGGSYTAKTLFGLSRVTPHLPGCRAGFKKVWLPDDDDS